MTPQARAGEAARLLDLVLAGEPAERALTAWARASRYAGAKDRAAVRDLVFDALRHRRSDAWRGGSETGRGLILGGLRRAGLDPAAILDGSRHALGPPGPAEGPDGGPAGGPAGGPMPRAVRLDLPDWLLDAFDASLGERADAVAATLAERAPVFLRVNLRRGTRDEAMASLAADGVGATLHPHVRTALQVTDNARRVATSSAYLAGLLEVQDASSQAAVLRLPLAEGSRVLDLCAGGGGKSLAMAALARLDLHAHDADPARMADLGPRAARAGVEVGRVADPATLAPFDLVYVDAPCSGSGTWRRGPDAKWRLTPDRLRQLVGIQAGLLERAAALLRPGGHLAYAVCSVLRDEGEAQVRRFLRGRAGWTQVDAWTALPDALGDGFHQAVIRRR